ncbi:PAS domain-containing protein [Paracoccus alkanivorans]|uniref:PAS domain-containing protein n=2 Tax=Paracoccus alkanivorans TaxID=2116655 RepID=A0A3M0MA83_9RHOB|nr:PAS domain-containing protein [Paracoccus alkanivorans]
MDTSVIWIAELAFVVGTLSVLFAMALIRAWDHMRGRNGRGSRGGAADRHIPTVFLFKNKKLIDATPPAHSLLSHRCAKGSEWQRLQGWIEARFPEAAVELSKPERPDRIELVGSNGPKGNEILLVIENMGEQLTRLTLSDIRPEQSSVSVDALSQQAMKEELDLLRHALDNTPTLIWRQDAQDRITWANAAYLKRAEEVASLGWPLPRLLDPPRTDAEFCRATLETDGKTYWFDCYSHAYGDETIFFALPADAAVRAEVILREFVQTLTKTFAALHIGLAIFDRQRNLQLFNPALIELTGLPAEMLATRPKLVDFLDQLRERRVVPEPRDYRSWRKTIGNLEAAAASGHHVEEWSLPGGQTYRVTGCPHPDGAVAFLFEDITSETSMTREFRAELLMGKTVLDGLDDALVVFGPGGKLVLSNRAYRDLWGGDARTVLDAIEGWKTRIKAGPGFDALCERLLMSEDEDKRSNGAISGPEGQLIGWTVSQISGGQRMLCFRMNRAVKPETATIPSKPAENSLSAAVGAY